ncbi:NACHT domain-containing protein [Corallococcus exiguus]|uniref:NACHT domain-containing protein n=1 Tax=Corallococcus exiguus TaxID=83462 RepID=UPI0015602764|nr:NACHT domain-containing protein [Corallococcus exiguus]NRD62949.1 NACHT domain-containing protein [Corallococcus exiguus]
MMTLTGIAIGLFARAIIKSGGEAILNNTQPLLDLFNKEIIAGASAEAPGFLKGLVEKLVLKRSTKERLLASGHIIDLAGLAWSEILTEQPDSLVEECTGVPTARELARQLDPYWFRNAITSPRATEVTFSLGASTPYDKINNTIIEKTIEIISTEITDELQLTDRNPAKLVTSIANSLPSRIQELWLDIPGMELRAARLNTESILSYVSGAVNRSDIHGAFKTSAEQLISSLHGDVFGRKTAQPNEPPILTHEKTYVEPEATSKKARTPHTAPADRGPVKTLIKNAWQSDASSPIVVLHAPFGYGKSLTVRSLAAELAKEWLAKPQTNPFPILLKCPEVLSGHISTLKAAVQSSLEKQLSLSQSALETIWSTQRLVLLLDSFDEVHMTEKEAKGWFGEMQQLSNSDRIRILLASRPHAFSSKWLSPTDWEIEIQPFDELRGQQWLNNVSGLLGPTGLTFKTVSATLDPELAGTPILLVMAAYGWNDTTTETPNSKAAIYRRFIEKISTGKWSDVQEAHRVVQSGMETLTDAAGPLAFRRALRLLAWQYLVFEQQFRQSQTPPGLSRRQVGDILQANFSGIGDEQIDAITRSLCLSLFLHKAAGTESVVFTHRSFREFLCAEHLVNILINDESAQQHISPAWRTLTEAELDDAEVAFFGELLSEHAPPVKTQALNKLDKWFKDDRHIFIKGKGKLQIEKTESDLEFGLAPPNQDRSETLRNNTEKLSLAGRNIDVPKLFRQLDEFDNSDRNYRRPCDDNENRTIFTLAARHPDQTWEFGYHVSSGSLCCISPISDLELYQQALERAPSLLLPITHISKSYFTCSSPGLLIRPFYYFDKKRAFDAFHQLGVLLREAEKKDIHVPRFSLHHLVQVGDHVMLGFCSDTFSIPTKPAWAKMALASLASAFSAEGIRARSPTEPGYIRSLTEMIPLMNILYQRDSRNWDEMLAAYQQASNIYFSQFYEPDSGDDADQE